MFAAFEGYFIEQSTLFSLVRAYFQIPLNEAMGSTERACDSGGRPRAGPPSADRGRAVARAPDTLPRTTDTVAYLGLQSPLPSPIRWAWQSWQTPGTRSGGSFISGVSMTFWCWQWFSRTCHTN
jgi:hypothetical protein